MQGTQRGRGQPCKVAKEVEAGLLSQPCRAVREVDSLGTCFHSIRFLDLVEFELGLLYYGRPYLWTSCIRLQAHNVYHLYPKTSMCCSQRGEVLSGVFYSLVWVTSFEYLTRTI